MPRMPQTHTKIINKRNSDCGYLYIDATTDYKISALSNKLEALAENPLKDIEISEVLDNDDYLLAEDLIEGAKKVSAEDAAKVLVINGGEID